MRLLLLIPIVILAGMIILSLLSRRGGPEGLVDGKLAPLPSKPNCVSSEEGTDPDKAVAPLSTTKEGLKHAINATGGEITSESDDYISSTYTSGLMRFVDDVEFRRDGKLWHVRSASRVGYSDMGANRKRVKALHQSL